MKDTIARIKAGEVTRETDEYGKGGFIDLLSDVIDINDFICIGDECDELNATCDLFWDLYDELTK